LAEFVYKKAKAPNLLPHPQAKEKTVQVLPFGESNYCHPGVSGYSFAEMPVTLTDVFVEFPNTVLHGDKHRNHQADA